MLVYSCFQKRGAYGGVAFSAPSDCALSVVGIRSPVTFPVVVDDGAGLLVNATSLGLEGRDPPLVALEGLPPAAVVMDMVYRPLPTGLLAAAADAGHVTVDGLEMLIGQAIPSFEAFFGCPPPAETDVRGLALAVLGER